MRADTTSVGRETEREAWSEQDGYFNNNTDTDDTTAFTDLRLTRRARPDVTTRSGPPLKDVLKRRSWGVGRGSACLVAKRGGRRLRDQVTLDRRGVGWGVRLSECIQNVS